ncbi:hypothetical protein NDU88_003670 [Pleurodeles waltl]|uniref:Uncharacterized protein n=1 Tax=Pleurodeles waltl TaxID=8319 RepID=A0AAV7PAK4_PLEWA|nr:hypothetical protein NDU88_003670 [Pleurodeles waltl]
MVAGGVLVGEAAPLQAPRARPHLSDKVPAFASSVGICQRTPGAPTGLPAGGWRSGGSKGPPRLSGSPRCRRRQVVRGVGITRLCPTDRPSPPVASRELRVHRLVPAGSLGADQGRNGGRRGQSRVKESILPSPRPHHLIDIAAAQSTLSRRPSYFVARQRPRQPILLKH